MTRQQPQPQRRRHAARPGLDRESGTFVPFAIAFPTATGTRVPRLAWKTVAAWTLTLALSAAVVAVLFFQLHGGRWFIVETPSMGTAAPVGTLVLTTPTTAAALHVGDVIAFHPPTTPGETYTHRIITISATGSITTRGDINGATDPWQLTDANLVGKATVLMPGAGWLIRGVPLMLIGFVALWLLTRLVKTATRRAAYRITGISLVFSVVSFVLKPFTGIVVEQTSVANGAPEATVVSTGLLPVRVTALHGTHADLATGQVGHLTVPASTHHEGFYAISSALHLDPWQWALLIGACCLPLLWTLIVGLPPKNDIAVADTAPAADTAPVKAAAVPSKVLA